ncbi:unnamed protein product [Ixodes pacificus]
MRLHGLGAMLCHSKASCADTVAYYCRLPRVILLTAHYDCLISYDYVCFVYCLQRAMYTLCCLSLRVTAFFA